MSPNAPAASPAPAMAADLLLVFGRPAAGAEPTLERSLPELAHAAGVVAARAFAVNVVLGERTPAFHPELVMCELDAGGDGIETAAATLGIGGGPRPDGLALAAWGATAIGARRDFELPAHAYLQFSAQPPSMSFDEYSDWYQVHQDENIAQSAVLRRGWRYRLHALGDAVEPGPTHLAVYEMEGTLERLTADLGRAMQAGVISLPDWFTRFASLEAIAGGERVGARG